VKKRTGDPWIPTAAYGALLPQFTVNLIVRSNGAGVYRKVLQAQVHYSDPDFAALHVLGVELMLHADHAYDHNPWSAGLEGGQPRGLGAELGLPGMDPDGVAERARGMNALFKDVSVRGHGWREVIVRDPDGYVWAVGETSGADG